MHAISAHLSTLLLSVPHLFPLMNCKAFSLHFAAFSLKLQCTLTLFMFFHRKRFVFSWMNILQCPLYYQAWLNLSFILYLICYDTISFLSSFILTWICVSTLSVLKEAQSCQCDQTEGGNSRKWPLVLYIWVHEGKSVSANERQVCMAVIFILLLQCVLIQLPELSFLSSCRTRLFTESSLRNIMFQILQGLAFIHKQGTLIYNCYI